jgi:hypothetical protein
MNLYKCLTIITLVCCFYFGSAQTIGEWTDYLSYASVKQVVDAGDKIYCVTDGGGLFSYDKTDNSVQKMSEITGLSDVGVQRVAYSKDNSMLLIAYQNSNIDLLAGGTIYNLSDIKRKQLSTTKTINNIMFSGTLAYLSCGFGIVVVNLEKKEIKDTYIIGDDGDYLSVMDLATDGEYFYAATVSGIYKASVSESNLQSYTNWVKDTGIPHATKEFNAIEYFNGHIIANYTPGLWDQDEMYQLSGSTWSRFLSSVTFVRDMTVYGNYIVFTGQQSVYVYDTSYELVKSVERYPISGYESDVVYSESAVIDAQNVLWIGYLKHGLVKISTSTESIIPAGPVDNNIFSLTMNGQDLWIASGGRDEAWNNTWTSPQFQLDRKGTWTVYDKTTFTNSNSFTDIVCVAVDPNNSDHVFAGSWGGGVLEFSGTTFVKRWDNYNSTLQTQLPGTPTQPYVRIGGMAFDASGNLWVTNTGVADVLSEYASDGTWKSYTLSGIANKFIGKVIVSQSDDKWVLVPLGYGLYALKSGNSTSKVQKVIAYYTNGTDEIYTEMNDLYSMVEDTNGQLWVGTSNGVAVFSTPANVWKDATMYASRPGLNLNDGKYHPLLESETITAIAVDGANRKWIGTKSTGVYLVSADGTSEIKHFTSSNSPLLNNNITDIAVNQKTGEVFIGTSSGLISYMGDATESNDEFGDVYVYPNPVRETFTGTIVITGLVESADVKITDITGNLVYKTTSLGGQATWNGNNLNGKRCKTGVYLVFLTDKNGDKTKVTKLLFIH